MTTLPNRIFKSDLQKKLEAEGWIFLTNLQIGFTTNLSDTDRLTQDLEFTKEAEIVSGAQKFLESVRKIYNEVREEKAFDINGCPLSPAYVAIYARGKKNQEPSKMYKILERAVEIFCSYLLR